MRILLIGERYSSNMGDGIICEVVETQLLNYLRHSEIIIADISGRQGYSTSVNESRFLTKGIYTGFKRKASKTLTRLGFDTEYIKFKIAASRKSKYIKDICSSEFDIAIFAGGQLFKDTFVFPIAEYVKCLTLNNIPIIFNACGVGKIESPKMRNLLSEVLSNPNVIAISTRDDISTIDNYYLSNSHRKAMVTFDPALWTEEVYKISKKDSNIVGLGIMYAHNMKFSDILVFWRGIVNKLNEKCIEWKMFCNGADKDYQLALYILDSLGYTNEERLKLSVPQPKTPKELVEIISTFKSIISFRLHSHIIAYSLDIPGVAIVWDEKLKFFYRSLGFENRCKNIKDSSLDIIRELESTQCKGYDYELRAKQKQYSHELLLKMIVGESVQQEVR